MNRLPVAPGDRNVPWRDVCPNTWRLEPVKYLCSINRRALPETTDPDTGFRYLDISGVDSEGNWVASELMRFADAPSRARRVVQDGDVIVSTVRTYLRAIAHIDKVEEPLICSTGFAVLSANGAVDSKFLAHWTRSVYFVDEIVARSVGVSYPAVNASDLGNIPCPLLPFDQQRAIGRFLDRETARIDALIEKKRRQIELLHEKRAALISHAVTKGLDPKARMKDSGVAWLGEIPEHWEVHRLKHVALVQFSSVDKHAVDGEEPVHLCNYVDVYYNDFIKEGLDFMAATATRSEIERFQLRQGDVLITKDSEAWDDIAVPAYVAQKLDDVLCGYHLAHIRPNRRKMLGEYLFRAFRSRGINDQFRVAANGITRFGLGKYWVDNGRFPIPPLDEQKAIAAFLRRETGKIDSLVEKINLSLDRLREYRTALISAAVTGKIDVRKEVA